MKFLGVFAVVLCGCSAGYVSSEAWQGEDAPIGADGRVIDTPEVEAAKIKHANVYLKEKLDLGRNAYAAQPVMVPSQQIPISAAYVAAYVDAPVVIRGAPIGPDGRVVDTLEVSAAKAAHSAAHVNEKINLANEAAKSADFYIINPSQRSW